jgi:SpoVK/Ycf46/Vps4 family AAA+-type ATPase
MRNAILTGPAAGDHVFVDLATGALPIREAMAQEARRQGYTMTLSVDAQGLIRFLDPDSEGRFQRATEAVSQDPALGSATPRPLRQSSNASTAPAEQTVRATPEGADSLMAAIGRIDRAQQRLSERFFIHFTDLSGLLTADSVPTPRARQVFDAIGRLLCAGRHHAASRVVVTVATAVHTTARELLTQHDHGATPWQIADIPLPGREEIDGFLKRAKDRHGLQGDVRATAIMLEQRNYTLTRISETLRRIIVDGGCDLTAIIGGEFDEAKFREAQARLDAMVGLTDLKREFMGLSEELTAIHEAMRRGQITEPASTHMALLGRPGTGKTEIARIVAKMLHASGLRRRDVCRSVTSADIIGEYNSGEAIQNIRRLLNESADGVLFIDEAYTLAENEWGRQAIDVLIAEMEERRGSLTVILAGYPERMQRLFEANEGLRSRLPHIFRLPDYSPSELCEIFDRKLKASAIDATPQARDRAHTIIRREATRRHSNGRDVRSLFESWTRNQRIARSHDLQATHVVDPRAPSKDAAENAKSEFEQKFKGLPEVEGWLNKTIHTSFDALGAGRLPRAPRLVFSGPPGTGKTETARTIGNFLRTCGVLKDGRVIETSLEKFTSQYVGGTEERTERHFRDAAECVLFIDEIYRFVGNQQGLAVLDQIVAALTNPEYDNVAVVIAGYEDRMSDVYRANGGLKERFDQTIRFAWPDTATLAGITLSQLNRVYGREPQDSELNSVRKAIELAIVEARRLPNFAGARSAGNLAKEINDKAVLRGGGSSITAADVPAPPPRPALSIVVERYLEEFPYSSDAAETLRSILAGVSVHSMGHVAKALGLCIFGGPGSGKSTFIRWFMQELASKPGMAPLPILECSAQSLQGTHLGEAQNNVRRVFEQARGGWLFIDEFHTLRGTVGLQTNLYSQEVAREIVAQMTAPQNTSTKVVIAGYPDHMEAALDLDPGLPSRFDKRYQLPDPSNEALARAAYHRLQADYGGTGAVSFETIESMLLRHFSECRRSAGSRFSGYRHADALAKTAAELAMVRADGDGSRFIIEIEDILGALHT